ncbi:NADPH-dependent FMN reductase [Salibacterium sp. K-3]
MAIYKPRVQSRVYTCPEKCYYLYGEWSHNPASFITYGGAGGARGIEQLRLVLIELTIVPLREALHISNFGYKFEDGYFIGDKNDVNQLGRVLEDILWWGSALKEARKTL